MKKIIIGIIFLICVFMITPVYAFTYLIFDSSLKSWVGQGKSVHVTPDDGYIFTARNYCPNSNSLLFLIASLNSPFGPNWDPSSGEKYYYWTLVLGAPYDNLVQVGHYGDTARYPFQDDDQPGLTFSGNHRGNNRNSGFFDVLEASYDPQGNVERFAVDFTQYGEEREDRWIRGQLRYNAAIPESATLVLFGTGLLGAFVRRKFKS